MAEQIASEKSFPIVGIGASAGGLDALQRFLAVLPQDFGFTLVFIQHLSSKHKSLLPELLAARRPSLVIQEISDGLKALPGRLYLAPPGKEVRILSGFFELTVHPEGLIHLPIDEFLASLAQDADGRSIAVIFSGAGTDGARGCQAIRTAGGTVFVQDPETAEYGSMPIAAIATGQADAVLSPEDICRELLKVQGIGAAAVSREYPISPEEYEEFFRLLREKTGSRFNHYKKSVVSRRIKRRMYLHGISTVNDYLALLSPDDAEAAHLASDLMIGVTSFFRDRVAWKALNLEAVRKLVAEKTDFPVRVWTPASASGEEAYSIAMMLRRELDVAGKKRDVQVFATDVNDRALERAREGKYPASITADVPQEYIQKYFTSTDDGNVLVINKDVRECVVFARQDLLTDPPFSKLDLIICRNFMIYLEPEAQEKCIRLFHYALNNGGFLFLGNAETVGRHSRLFQSIGRKQCRVYRKLESKIASRLPISVPYATERQAPPAKQARMTEQGRSVVEIIQERLLEEYGPASVAIDQNYEIVYHNGPTNLYLRQPRGVPTQNLLELLPESLRSRIRGALYRSGRGEMPVVIRTSVAGEDNRKRQVSLRITKAAENLYLVVFQEKGAPSKKEAAEAVDATVIEETAIHQLESELSATRAHLQSYIEQLKSLNEELQSSNEELQAANEELETSREELQSLNEELITVNSQLQGKIEEQDVTNNDLNNFLASTNIPTIFLDTHFRVKRFTPAMLKLIKLLPSDVGRPIIDMSQDNLGPDLISDAETVLEQLMSLRRELELSGAWYVRATLPYRTADNRIEGVVVTYTDVSELKMAEERTRHLASFPQFNPSPVLEVNSTGSIIYSNAATQRVLEGLGLNKDDITVFLPHDIDGILGNLNKNIEETLAREVTFADKIFEETIYVAPRFRAVRIYVFDITERKRAEEALQESEQRVRLKLNSILSPEGDIGTLELGDIIDAPAIQSLMEKFYELTNIPLAVIDLKGKVLVGMGWQEICTKFHRVHPETCGYCIESDTLLTQDVPAGEYKLYKCKNNMWDVATAIEVGGRTLGHFFTGQFLFDDERPDYEFFRTQAKQYGFAEKEYLAALDKVPRLSRATVDRVMGFFMKLSAMVSQLSYSNIKLARSLAERDALMDSLRKSQQQNEFLADIVRRAAQPFGQGFPDGRLGLINKAFEQLTGYSEEELRSLDWDAVLTPPEWREFEKRKLEELNHTGKPVRYEKEYVRKDGARVPIELLVHLVPGPDGKPQYYYSFITDITVRKKAEEALGRLAAIVESAEDAIIGKDLNGVIQSWNVGAEKIFGYKAEEVIGKNVSFLIPPGHDDEVPGIIARIRQGEHIDNYETLRLRKDGTMIPVSLKFSAIKDANGNVIGASKIAHDITTRKRAEEALLLSEEKFALAFANNPAAVVLTRLEDGLFLDVNNTWVALNGYSRDEVIGQSARTLPIWPNAEDQARFVRELREEGIVRGREQEFRSKSGEVFVVQLSAQVLTIRGEKVILTTEVDITERKRAEEELRWSEQRYRELFENMVEGYAYCKMVFENGKPQDFIYLSVNHAFEKLTGLTNVVGKSVTEIIPGIRETDKELFEIYGRVAQTCKSERFEMFVEALKMWFSISVYCPEQGFFVAVFDIITERKMAEEALLRLNKALKALSDSSQTVIHAQDEPQYLNSVCRIVTEDCGYSMVWIGFAENDEAKSVRPVAYSGFEEGYLETLKLSWADTERGRGPTGTAIRTGNVAVCRNMLIDPAFAPWREEALKRGYASSIVFPLRADGKVFGAITMYSRKPDPFTEDEVRLLTELTDNVAYGIEVLRIRATQKMAEEALRESEERVRRKLDSILSPEGDIGDLDLSDIIDARAVQALMDDFYKLAHMPMAIIDLKGRVLVGTGWQKICTEFHRGHPETCRNCIESDLQLTAGVPLGEFKLYKCKNNMWDVSTPIVVGGKYMGNLFLGQFFFEEEPLDYELFRSQAKQYGFDEKKYLAALDAVPRLSRDSLNTSMAFFLKLADVLSRSSYSNLKLARSLAQRDALMGSLRESEDRLKRAQEISHLGSWELDLVNNRLTWSDEVYRIFGLQPQEFNATYEAFLEAVHPDDRAAVDAAYSGSVREGKDSYDIEHRIVRKATGEVRIIHEKCEHIRDDSGRIIRSVGMVHDITGRKKAEAALRESEEQFRSLADSIPNLAWWADADGYITWYNRRWYDYTGTTPEQMEGWGWQSVHDPEMLPKVLERWKKSIATGEPFYMEFPLRGADGIFRSFLTRVLPLRDSADKVVRWFGTNTDVSAMKKAEEALRRSEEKYRSLFENMIDGLAYHRIVTDENGKPVDYVFLEANGAFEKLTGLKRADTIGKSARKALPGIENDPADWIGTYGNVALTGQAARFQHYAAPLGRWYSVSAYSPMKEYFVTIFEDITESKKAEADVIKLSEDMAARNFELESANKEMESFIYSISHDLRAPIRSMSGFSKIIIEDYADKFDEQGKDYLSRIQGGAERATQLIDDLLRLARISRQDMDLIEVDLSKKAMSVTAELREANAGRNVDVVIAPGLTALADPRLIEVVFSNLLGNAWKFTSKTEKARIEFGSAEIDGKTVYYVKDNGAGFDPAYADKMFWPFHRLHSDNEFEGTGIGLTIVERVVRRHGGRIWAEGEVGKGATVYFTLGGRKED